MIAYSKASLEKSRINETAEMWKEKGLISSMSLEKVKENYKADLYTPNLFIRIALFLFTAILVSAAIGLITLITLGLGGLDEDETSSGIRLIIYGIMVLVTLEVIIKNKKVYRAGIDDALVYAGLSLLIGGINILAYVCINQSGDENLYRNQELISLLFVFPILVAGAIRYTDMLVSAAAYCCLFAIMFLFLNQAGQLAQTLLPFAGIIFSGIAYFLIKKFQVWESFFHWKNSMTMIEILSLFTFYFSGNYLVVREMSESLLDMKLPEGQDIPLAILFYLFTALIPLAYLFRAIQSKDRIMLRTGLVIFAMAVLTFKYYYSLGHHEISLTLAGILMIAFAWILLKFLSVPRNGFTTKEDKHTNALLNTDIETIAIAEGFKNPGQDKEINFGGGKFGGGGAGSGY